MVNRQSILAHGTGREVDVNLRRVLRNAVIEVLPAAKGRLVERANDQMVRSVL
jgi:hypothetical protein